MGSNENQLFKDNKQVQGMKLPEYLDWATGNRKYEKPLKLPPIQRGFVWKPKQIVDLWDSLLRGMPIGSMMVTKLVGTGCDLTTKKTEEIEKEAIGLLDGQQRTLAMMIGSPFSDRTEPTPYCLWIDLAEEGYKGAPFKIRLTTSAQPFGFDHISHSKLSKYERKRAREKYDEKHKKYLTKPDYELFDLSKEDESEQPRPWKADGKIDFFIRIKDLWRAFRKNNNEAAFLDEVKSMIKSARDFSGLLANDQLSKLYKAFVCMESLEVPLILIPEHISISKPETSPNDVTDPLVLLFERIGRSGASLSAEDLLFSMIKRQWPGAQDLVNNIHNKIEVKAFMSATDYVVTAFRLAVAQYNDCEDKHKIADTPRPNPSDFHRHLNNLLGKEEHEDKPLRNYLKKDDSLINKAFEKLYNTLLYRRDSEQEDIGLPSLMMPHLPRGLIQVLLRWIMLNSSDEQVIKDNRQAIISFTLFWYLNIWHEDKASKEAFGIITKEDKSGTFPALKLLEELTAAPEGEIGLALPLMSYERLRDILNRGDSTLLRSYDEVFDKKSSFAERELYKRFCWWRNKPVLLWLQRAYVHDRFASSLDKFAGLIDEDTVPYDYDHLCPQKHWGSDWRNIIKKSDENSPVIKAFRDNRSVVGNCIGNLHVLESSLNRSYGDDPLALKIKKGFESEIELEKWSPEDSLLYHCDEHKRLWEKASPCVDSKNGDESNRTWDEVRLQNFQSAIYRRAEGLYHQYYEACKHIIK